MNAPYKHRRTYNPSTAFPTLNPGEIAINGANRQLAVGDTSGTPLDLLGVRLFDARAIYFEDDLIAHEGQVLRAIATLSPGAFDPADWESISGGGTAADIINVPAGGIAATDVQAAINELDAEKAPVVHTHPISDVTGLQTSLDGKAPTVHTHAIADVTSLQTALDGKVSKTGDIMTGDLGITKASPALSLDTTGAGTNGTIWGRRGGANRWVIEMPNTAAEGGADAGSDFALSAFSDAGALTNAFSISRASRVMAFDKSPTAPTPAPLDDSTKLATTEFNNHAARLLNSLAGTTHTFVLADAGKVVVTYNVAATTLTVPLNSAVAFPIGTQIDILQANAGQVTIAPFAGVTIVSEDSKFKLTKTYASATLLQTSPNVWVLFGSLVA